MARVMLVGLDKHEIKKLERIYNTVNVPCETIPTIEAALDRIAAEPPALIVAEKPERLASLLSLRDTLKTRAPATPFIVTMNRSGVSSALESLKAGAYDCVARPYNRLDVLAASKRATSTYGRTLFVARVQPVRWRRLPVILGFVLFLFFVKMGQEELAGPPTNSVSLGSVHLSGLQWEDRNLWVGDWYESTITRYALEMGFTKNSRGLVAKDIYHLQEGQPILVCNTSEALITIDSDLKIRSHQRSVGLPTIQSASVPGSEPTGLAWDGENVWSADAQTGFLYRHGLDLRVLDKVKSILPRPMGVTWYESSLWVLGDNPLRVARMQRTSSGVLWQGPYRAENILPEGVIPSGMAIGYGRLWLISGGDPRTVSMPLSELIQRLSGWEKYQKKSWFHLWK